MLGRLPPDSPIHKQHAEPNERENRCNNPRQIPRVKDLIKFAFSGRVPSVENHWNGGYQQTNTPASGHHHQCHSPRYVSVIKWNRRKSLRPRQMSPKIGPKSIWFFYFDIVLMVKQEIIKLPDESD